MYKILNTRKLHILYTNNKTLQIMNHDIHYYFIITQVLLKLNRRLNTMYNYINVYIGE